MTRSMVDITADIKRLREAEEAEARREWRLIAMAGWVVLAALVVVTVPLAHEALSTLDMEIARHAPL